MLNGGKTHTALQGQSLRWQRRRLSCILLSFTRACRCPLGQAPSLTLPRWAWLLQATRRARAVRHAASGSRRHSGRGWAGAGGGRPSAREPRLRRRRHCRHGTRRRRCRLSRSRSSGGRRSRSSRWRRRRRRRRFRLRRRRRRRRRRRVCGELLPQEEREEAPLVGSVDEVAHERDRGREGARMVEPAARHLVRGRR